MTKQTIKVGDHVAFEATGEGAITERYLTSGKHYLVEEATTAAFSIKDDNNSPIDCCIKEHASSHIYVNYSNLIQYWHVVDIPQQENNLPLSEDLPPPAFLKEQEIGGTASPLREALLEAFSKNNLFHTPEDVNELITWVRSFPKEDQGQLMMAVMLTQNLAAKTIRDLLAEHKS